MGTQYLSKMFSTYIGLDLGTANCLVYVGDQGVVLAEPSVVAVRVNNQAVHSVIAVGSEARDMLGKTPGNIKAIRPMKDGVIANFQITEEMLRHFIKKGNQRSTNVTFCFDNSGIAHVLFLLCLFSVYKCIVSLFLKKSKVFLS